MSVNQEQTKETSATAPTICRIKVVARVDQSWTIKRIIDEQCPVTWEPLFWEARFDIASISHTLDREERAGQIYYPMKADLFNAYRFTPLTKPDGSANVKVVIIGQDPYHGTYVDMLGNARPQAMGLSFSVNPDCPIPPSLLNMFKELERTIPGYTRPTHGSLLGWAQQGVLMLNTALAVKPGQPGKAGGWLELWEGPLKKTLKIIEKVNPYCVFVLMGAEAQKAVAPFLDRLSEKVESAHPASRPMKNGGVSPFFGSDIFRRTNAILIKQGHTPINWQT